MTKINQLKEAIENHLPIDPRESRIRTRIENYCLDLDILFKGNTCFVCHKDFSGEIKTSDLEWLLAFFIFSKNGEQETYNKIKGWQLLS